MHTYSYADRLSMLKLYSLQRRRDRYTIIYVWKVLESIVPNLNIPITCYSSIRRGRLCTTSHVEIGHLGTLVYHSFRFRGIRLFNAMPKQIRDLSCSVSSFKYQLDKYLSTIPDTPCIANYDNSLENSLHWRRKSVVIVQMMQSVAACTGELMSYNNDYRGITCWNPNVVETMISIYERMANEALLRKITHGKTQKTKWVLKFNPQTEFNKKGLE